MVRNGRSWIEILKKQTAQISRGHVSYQGFQSETRLSGHDNILAAAHVR